MTHETTQRPWTPGPWGIEYDGGHPHQIVKGWDSAEMLILVAEVESEADAHLIAAAPLLYSALFDAWDGLRGHVPVALTERWEQVLAQARGEA